MAFGEFIRVLKDRASSHPSWEQTRPLDTGLPLLIVDTEGVIATLVRADQALDSVPREDKFLSTSIREVTVVLRPDIRKDIITLNRKYNLVIATSGRSEDSVRILDEILEHSGLRGSFRAIFRGYQEFGRRDRIDISGKITPGFLSNKNRDKVLKNPSEMAKLLQFTGSVILLDDNRDEIENAEKSGCDPIQVPEFYPGGEYDRPLSEIADVLF